SSVQPRESALNVGAFTRPSSCATSGAWDVLSRCDQCFTSSEPTQFRTMGRMGIRQLDAVCSRRAPEQATRRGHDRHCAVDRDAARQECSLPAIGCGGSLPGEPQVTPGRGAAYTGRWVGSPTPIGGVPPTTNVERVKRSEERRVGKEGREEGGREGCEDSGGA